MVAPSRSRADAVRSGASARSRAGALGPVGPCRPGRARLRAHRAGCAARHPAPGQSGAGHRADLRGAPGRRRARATLRPRERRAVRGRRAHRAAGLRRRDLGRDADRGSDRRLPRWVRPGGVRRRLPRGARLGSPHLDLRARDARGRGRHLRLRARRALTLLAAERRHRGWAAAVPDRRRVQGGAGHDRAPRGVALPPRSTGSEVIELVTFAISGGCSTACPRAPGPDVVVTTDAAGAYSAEVSAWTLEALADSSSSQLSLFVTPPAGMKVVAVTQSSTLPIGPIAPNVPEWYFMLVRDLPGPIDITPPAP